MVRHVVLIRYTICRWVMGYRPGVECDDLSERLKVRDESARVSKTGDIKRPRSHLQGTLNHFDDGLDDDLLIQRMSRVRWQRELATLPSPRAACCCVPMLALTSATDPQATAPFYCFPPLATYPLRTLGVRIRTDMAGQEVKAG